MSHGCPLTSSGSASRVDSAALHVTFDALPLHGIGLMALLVAFTPLFNIVLILAFGTLVAGILRAQVPSLATRYISELSAFHDALLPTIGFGLVFLLPDVLDILVAVTRRYGKAVIRGATALNDEAATVGRLTVFLAVVLDFTVDVPFVRSFHAAEPSEPPTTTPGPLTWPTYVVGTVAQYMPDLPSEGTLEATRAVVSVECPGLLGFVISECSRHHALASLSRGTAGIRNTTVLANVPGNPQGASEVIPLLLPLLLHAVADLNGWRDSEQ